MRTPVGQPMVNRLKIMLIRIFLGDVAVVHNGIIENYQELKDDLEALGYVFTSQTDTEVVAHLVN